jgi:outer membrane receptor protein involved in Fe transport
MDIFVPLSRPGSSLSSLTHNYTNLGTAGFRAEAVKVIGGGSLLTYGLDFFRDRSENTDRQTTTVTGFGPPATTTSTTPQVPNASFRSAGVFLQGDLGVTNRLSLVVGARGQDILARAQATEGLAFGSVKSRDRAVVGAVNARYELSSGIALVASTGRAFRAPNLVERFFNGPTPEGSGYQVRNPALNPETSLNTDLGFKVRTGGVYAEVFAYRNSIRDGIRSQPTGQRVGRLAEFRNINVDRLRDQGLEAYLVGEIGAGFNVRGGYTRHATKNVLAPDSPVGDTYGSRSTIAVGYRHPAERFWISYDVRHNGERQDVNLGSSPVGATLPAFTVHGARGGVRFGLFGDTQHEITIGITNLTNRLYAEAANTSFFRPEPKRTLVVSWSVSYGTR